MSKRSLPNPPPAPYAKKSKTEAGSSTWKQFPIIAPSKSAYFKPYVAKPAVITDYANQDEKDKGGIFIFNAGSFASLLGSIGQMDRRKRELGAPGGGGEAESLPPLRIASISTFHFCLFPLSLYPDEGLKGV
eukprot:1350281-Amorphochlora_amoeboformis.AAC.1